MIKQTLAVLGACGAQGKSVIEQVKSLPNWRVIGLTHRPDCDVAKKLQEESNIEVFGFVPLQNQLASLLQGVDVVFASAYDWDPHLHLDNEEFETKFGQEIIKSCELAQVKHIIWSSLSHVRPGAATASGASQETSRKLKKPVVETPESFESKKKLEELLTNSSSLNWTILYSGFFMDNFQKFTPFEQVDGGKFVLKALPYLHKSTVLPLFHVTDMGKIVQSLLLATIQNYSHLKLCLYAEKKNLSDVMNEFARIIHADTVSLERLHEEKERTNNNTRELVDVLHWFKHDGFETLEQACALHNNKYLSSISKNFSSDQQELQHQQLIFPWTRPSSTVSLTTFEQWVGQHKDLFVSKISTT